MMLLLRLLLKLPLVYPQSTSLLWPDVDDGQAGGQPVERSGG